MRAGGSRRSVRCGRISAGWGAPRRPRGRARARVSAVPPRVTGALTTRAGIGGGVRGHRAAEGALQFLEGDEFAHFAPGLGVRAYQSCASSWLVRGTSAPLSGPRLAGGSSKKWLMESSNT